MDSFEDAWELICSYCQTKITDVAYNTWISRIKPLKLDFESNTAYLIVPNDFHRQTITRCYIPLLNEAFEAVFQNKFIVSFKTPEEVEEYKSKTPEIKEEVTEPVKEVTPVEENKDTPKEQEKVVLIKDNKILKIYKRK